MGLLYIIFKALSMLCGIIDFSFKSILIQTALLKVLSAGLFEFFRRIPMFIVQLQTVLPYDLQT